MSMEIDLELATTSDLDDINTSLSGKANISGTYSGLNVGKVNGHTVNSDVPSNAKFTDTNTWRGIQDNLTSDSTTDSLSAKQGKILNDKLTGLGQITYDDTNKELTIPARFITYNAVEKSLTISTI